MTTSRRRGLASRLLLAQLLVLLVAAATAALLATAVGPSVFADHLGRVSRQDTAAETAAHAEEAFLTASLISVGVALAAGLVVALAVSAYVTRRITRPVAALADASRDVAAGHYEVSVPTPALGAEFDTLAASFTAMASRLRDVETTRRRLLADLAHEMRTPVATLEAYLEGFEDGVAELDVPTAAMLRTETRRLARLAEDITAVSRAEEQQLTLNLTPTAPDRLVRDAVGAAAERFAAAGVELRSDVGADLPPVRVDPDRFAQILGNLLDNALLHTPAGGRVTVLARAGAKPDDRNDDRAGGRSGAVVFEVVDTGDGIPAEHLPHLFERFYRVDAARDRAHGGSGIGLAITQALVRAHGGRVSAASAGAGRGATFTVTVPAPSSRSRPPTSC